MDDTVYVPGGHGTDQEQFYITYKGFGDCEIDAQC